MAIPPRDGPAFEGENALTDAQAEDQLMALLPGNEPDNSDAEGDQDAIETETLEADDQPQDNLGTEATADDQDLIIEDEGEDAEAVGPAVYEVPWDDGSVRQMTAEEIRAGTLMRADYDRKQAERARAEEAAAQAKQSFEAKGTALDGMLAELSRLKDTGLPTPPTPELARDDPAEYIARKADYDAKTAVVQQAQREANEERARQLDDAKRANAEKLLTSIPEWQDVQRQQQDLAAINAMGSKAGYWTQDAFNEGISTTPYWQIELWRDAMRYREAVARQKGKGNGTTKRVVKVQPTVRSQASQPQSARPRKAAEAAMDRFRKNPGGAGHEDLAIDALLARAESKVGSQRRRG